MTNGNGKMRTEEESRQALFLRLIKVMGMTTSDNDNVNLVALARAREILDKLETSWEALLKGKVTIIADPFTVKAPPPPMAPPRAQPQPAKPRPAAQPTYQSPPRPQPASQAKPAWKPAPPPRFTDRAQIQACLDKISKNPIKHQGTQWRIKQIERDFQAKGSLEQADWSFLAGTAAALRGATVTADML